MSVDSFVKKSSFIYYTENELEKAKDDIVKLADTEGLRLTLIQLRLDLNNILEVLI